MMISSWMKWPAHHCGFSVNQLFIVAVVFCGCQAFASPFETRTAVNSRTRGIRILIVFQPPRFASSKPQARPRLAPSLRSWQTVGAAIQAVI